MSEQKSLGQIAYEADWFNAAPWADSLGVHNDWEIIANAVASAVRAQCIEAVLGERLGETPVTESDIAYEQAISDAIAAIEQLEQPK